VIYLNSSKGLGDAIYLRAATLYLLERGESVTVFTRWPDVFSGLPVAIRPVGEREGRLDLCQFACSLGRLNLENFSNFSACCKKARFEKTIELRIDWSVRNKALVDRVVREAKGRKVFVYQPVKTPHNDLQALATPHRDAYNRVVVEHGEYFRVRLGMPPYVEEDRGAPCEMDLFGRASISDAFDIATVGDLFFGQHCYIPMLAEAMDKRFVCMFSRRALGSVEKIRNFRPDRLIHKKHLGTVVYDEA